MNPPQNSALFSGVTLERREAEVLAEVGRLVSQSLDPKEVGQRIVDSVLQLLNAKSSALYRLEPESGDLVGLAVSGDVGPTFGRALVLPKGTGVAGLAARERRSVVTPDILTDPQVALTPELRARVEQTPVRAVLAVPLLIKDALIGALGVGDRAGRIFTEEEIRLAQAFADQAAIALENARLYEESQARLREAQTFLAVSQTVGSSFDLTEILRRVARETARALGVDMVGAYLADPDGRVLRPLAGYHVPKHLLNAFMRFPIPLKGHRFLEKAWELKSPVSSSDAETDPRIDRETFDRFPHRSVLFFPMVVKGEPIGGLFVVWWEERHHFTSEELRLVEGISRQAGLAVENSRLYMETERRRKAAESLAEVGRLISQSLNPDEVSQRVVDSTLRLLGVQTSALFRLEPESEDLVVLAVSGDAGPAFGQNLVLPKGTGVAGLAVQERRPMVTPDILIDPRIMLTPELRVAIEQMPCRTVLDVPLVVKDTVIGALGVGDRAGRVFDEEEIRLLQGFAAQAAVALENARLYGELRGVLQEIEASQQRIIQTERLRALGEMAGGVTHDFNNILAIILGRIQLLLAETRDLSLQQQLRVMEQAAMDGARTVRRIQEFTRRRPTRPFESVDLNQLIEEIVEVTRPRWKDEAQLRGIRYDVRVEPTPLPSVAGDASELREVLANLVFNALDAMPEGGRLTFRTGTKGERVYCVVADTGVGMPGGVKQRVFEPFFTTKAEKGSGLGLSVAYGIVARHGGEIEVQSQVGQGSAFTIWLAVGLKIAEAPKKVRPTRPERRAKILVIDDEPEIRKLLFDVLVGQGHTVAACADGASGLARFLEERFDLVITDLGMPGLSGWEVARSVSARSPETPVVLITGWGDQIDPEEASAKSVKFLVTKPFRLEDIRAVVNQAVSRQPASVPTPKATRRGTPRARRNPAS